jgi:hypothetical protein
LSLAFACPVRAAEGPLELAGLRLGDTATAAGAKLRLEAVAAPSGRTGLSMVPVAPVAGFRSGYVDVGQCADPGRIVRVKMHYADDSLEFFNTILAALKKRYGEPSQWRGNAFGTLRTWKWSLRAADDTAVSLIVMHYAGDDGSFTQGNSIRIAASDRARREERCVAAKKADEARISTAAPVPADTLGLEGFLPH